MKEPHDTANWQEIDWSKSSSRVKRSFDFHRMGLARHADCYAAAGYLPDDEIDPIYNPGAKGSSICSGDVSEVRSGMGKSPHLPKAKVNITPGTIQIGMGDQPSFKAGEAQQQEQDQTDASKDTNIPFVFSLDPDRPWTRDDLENLCDIIDSGERDFAKISRQMQRTEDQCHRKYQYQACLRVKKPRFGEWSAEEDAMLARFIEEYKMTDWDRIAFHCGTTNAEARRHWASRNLIRSTPQGKRSQSDANTTLVVNSATTGAMMNALDDVLGSEDNAKIETSLTPLARIAYSSRDGSKNDIIPIGKPLIASSKAFESTAPATVQETEAQGEGSPAVVRKRKRAHAEDVKVNGDGISSMQPERKIRRTCNPKATSASGILGPISAKELRRSSRHGRGERILADDVLWYDHNKVKSLSKKGLEDDIAVKQSTSHLIRKEVELKCKRAIKNNEPRGEGKAKRVTGIKSDDRKASLTNTSQARKIHANAVVEEVGEVETGRCRTGRSDIPRVAIESSRIGSASAPEGKALLPTQRVSKQKAKIPQKVVAVSVLAPETAGKGRKRGRETQPDGHAQEDGPAKETKKDGILTASAPEADSKARGHSGKSTTNEGPAPKIVDDGRKRPREAESDIEPDPPRKTRLTRSGQTGHLRPASDLREAGLATPRTQIAVETPSASHTRISENEVLEAGPWMQLRKPRHRAGIDRRAGRYPRTHRPHM